MSGPQAIQRRAEEVNAADMRGSDDETAPLAIDHKSATVSYPQNSMLHFGTVAGSTGSPVNRCSPTILTGDCPCLPLL
jgi:hypothetical protein